MTKPTPIASKQPELQPKKHVRDPEVNPFLESLPITAQCVADQAQAAITLCPFCGQQMRGIDWIERLIAERDALRQKLDRLAVSLLAVTDDLQERCDTLDFMSDEHAEDIREARAALASLDKKEWML